MTTHKKELLLPIKRDYKSRMFTMIFSEKKELLALYNAVSGKNYTNPEELVITTLENAIYMSMKNDVSFIIDSRLSLYEHQSTYNPNIPLRFLMYLADLYSSLTKGKNLYGTKRIQIPAPKFIVFYNGVIRRPDFEVLKLSELYEMQREENSLELQVEVLNINRGHNKELMKACKTLQHYSEYIYRIRKYAKEMLIDDAVEKTITECIQEGILKTFLEQHRAEAKAMSIYEYNEEEHMRMEREDAYEEGHKEGLEEGHEAGMIEGCAEGQNRMIQLIQKMTADGLLENIPRLASEPEFLKEMLKKYVVEAK